MTGAAGARPRGYAIALDVGGTFTDVSLLDPGGRLWITKTPTTPHDPSEGFLAGVLKALRLAGVEPAALAQVLHGTTTATNAILERTGAATALLTTAGFRYVLEIGRHDIPRRANMFAWVKPARPVPPELVFEVPGRIAVDGEELEALERRLYTYALPDAPVEIVTLRVAAAGRVRRFGLPRLGGRAGKGGRPRPGRWRVYFAGAGWVDCPGLDRATLAAGAVVAGPAVVEQLDSTTVVLPGWRATVDPFGNLVVRAASRRRAPAAGRRAASGAGRAPRAVPVVAPARRRAR